MRRVHTLTGRPCGLGLAVRGGKAPRPLRARGAGVARANAAYAFAIYIFPGELKKREEFFIHRAERVKKNKESDTKSDLQHEKDKRSAKERKRRMGRTEETREKDNDATLA